MLLVYGNPGLRYENTRHNFGFMAIDEIASKLGINVTKNKFNALIGDGIFNGEKIILVKPQTYMNLSGESVIQILEFYKVPLQNLIVIYDDIDLPFGGLRIKPNGSPGTHNGMRNITELLKSQDFVRIRMGSGRPTSGIDLKDYVLMKMNDEEINQVKILVEKVYKSVIEIFEHNVSSAMNLYNKSGE